MANNIKGITIEIGGDVTKLDSALKNVNKETGNLKRELKEVEKSLKLDPGNVELLAQKQKVLKESIEATSEKLKTLKEAEEQARQAFEAGELPEDKYRALQREVLNTEAELKKLEQEAKSTGSTLESMGQKVQDVGQKFQDVGGKIQNVGEGMQNAGQKLMPVTAAITGVGVASVAAATDFEDAIAKLSTIADTSKETGVPLEELEKQIMSLSDQTGISASEIADNVYNAISAGQKTGDAVNFVAQSSKLATAGFAESGQALDLLTTILNAYGMEAEEVNHVSDVLINTQNLGKTTVGELASAMGKVIPTANASNVSLENLAAGYSIMTANGIATAESTTYMNSMLNELSKSGTKASDVIKEKTGKSFQELMADGASLADVLVILEDAANENGVAMGDMFGSAEAGKAALTLLSGGAEQFNETLQSMNESTGATEEAFAKLDTTSRKGKIALNEIKNSAIELGSTILEMVMPYFEKLTGKIKDATTWFNNLDDSQKQMIVKIAAIVAAIGPALIIGGKIVSGIGLLVTGVGKVINIVGSAIKVIGMIKNAFVAFNAVLMANPVVLIVAAIAALIAAFVLLYNKCEWFRDGVNAIWAAVKDAFFKAFDGIKTFFTETLPNAFNSIVKFIQGNWQGLLLLIVNPFAGAFKLLYDNCETFRQFVDGFVQKIKDFFQKLWDGIVNIFQNVGKWFSDRFTEAYNNITKAFQNIGQWFGQRWTDIKNALSQVATWFQKMFQDAYTNLTNVFKAIGQWFAARWTDIKNALSQVASWFQTTFQNAYTNVTNAFKAIGQWFSARYTDITNAIKGIPEYFRTCFQNAFNNITSVFSGIGDWFKTNVIDKIKSVFDNFNFRNIGENIVNAIKNGISSISLPKLSISWSTSEKKEGDGPLIKIPVPHLTWNALGGIMTKPTIFGMYGGSLQGGGEAGQEAILPLDIFYRRVENYIDSAVERTAFAAAGGTGGGNFIQNNNYYSPKELSPSEAARQTRNATRKMVQTITKGRN